MEHRHDQHVADERLHPSFRDAEGKFREEAGRLWSAEEDLRSRLRSDPSLTPEERQDRYRLQHGELQRRYEDLASKFSTSVSRSVADAQQLLTKGTGARFSDHLMAIANIPDERLPEVMATAKRSQQEDLERVVALTAYERGLRPVWQAWAESNPQRAEAVELVRSTPGAAQFATRVGTMRPPRADLDAIASAPADVQAAEQRTAESEAARQAFFVARSSDPRRQVGRRLS